MKTSRKDIQEILKIEGCKADYHIHTTCSDGECAPAQIVRQLKLLGYDRMSVTDHDNTDGLEEAGVCAEAEGIRLIPGIEIATRTEQGIGLHMLGYDFDRENGPFRELLAQLIRNREERNVRLLKVLGEMGYELTMEDLETGKNSFVGKPVIARAMVRRGYIANERTAFGKEILGSPQCRAVRKAKPLTSEAIETILGAGGFPVLAHPIQARGIGQTGSEEFFENIEKIIASLTEQGLQGLECYHPDHSEAQAERFTKIADKYGLHITRGTDFHGPDYATALETGVFQTARSTNT